MSKELGPRPNLDHLREQAKDLLSAYRRGEPEALSRFGEGLPSQPSRIALHDAQSVVAREYGFPSWPKLVAHVEEVRALAGITDEVENEFIEAVLSDDVPRIRRLLELYPGVGRTSAACALVSAEVELVRSLDATSRLGPKCWTPIEYVAHSRIYRAFPERYEAQLECATSLLDRGADPNSYHLWIADRPDTPLSALFGAAGGSGHVGIVRRLLERGANPDDGESVYHAAEHNRREVLEALLEHGADISGRDLNWGNTPVYFLTGFGESYPTGGSALEGIRWLLEHGADPNIACSDLRETPLHYACRTGRGRDLVSLLLRHGADGKLLDANGDTPYQLAMASGNWEAAEVLQEHGAETELATAHRFLAACTRNDRAAIRQMLASQPTLVEELMPRGKSLMNRLAFQGRTDGLAGLVHAGFPLRGEETVTPLHEAGFRGQAGAVRFLIEHGAPLDALDDEHQATPLAWVTFGARFNRNPKGDYPEVVRLLLAAGSPVEAAERDMASPLMPGDVAESIREALSAYHKSGT